MPFKNKHLGENIIIADADYVDKVAFNLIVNFERMIGRHIPQADMAQWVECIALDGGCQEKPAEASTPLTSVILIHDVAKREMDNFNPGIFGDNLPPNSDEDIEESSVLNGRAFKGRLGEFSFSTLSGEAHQETMTKADIFLDVLAALADEHHVRRIMLVPDLEQDKGMAGLLQKQMENFVLAAAFEYAGKPNLVLMYSQDLVAKGKNAGKDVREAAKSILGGGGGQPGLATAGGKDVAGLRDALARLVELATA